MSCATGSGPSTAVRSRPCCNRNRVRRKGFATQRTEQRRSARSDPRRRRRRPQTFNPKRRRRRQPSRRRRPQIPRSHPQTLRRTATPRAPKSPPSSSRPGRHTRSYTTGRRPPPVTRRSSPPLTLADAGRRNRVQTLQFPSRGGATRYMSILPPPHCSASSRCRPWPRRHPARTQPLARDRPRARHRRVTAAF